MKPKRLPFATTILALIVCAALPPSTYAGGSNGTGAAGAPGRSAGSGPPAKAPSR